MIKYPQMLRSRRSCKLLTVEFYLSVSYDRFGGDIIVDIGNIIYTKRKEKGLSQEQLAEAIGVARQTVSKWETSETLPDVESLQKLAIFLAFPWIRPWG